MIDESLPYVPAPKPARIEIIPLIDVIFFLLATFVLFTLSLQKLGDLEMALPKAGHEGPIDQTVYVQASVDGTFYWKQGRLTPPELITASEIRPRLEDYRRHVADPRVFIRGDTKARLGSAVMLLDEVRKAGITQVSVETLASPTGG
jgi:biopolymer transport protein ExbD